MAVEFGIPPSIMESVLQQVDDLPLTPEDHQVATGDNTPDTHIPGLTTVSIPNGGEKPHVPANRSPRRPIFDRTKLIFH